MTSEHQTYGQFVTEKLESLVDAKIATAAGGDHWSASWRYARVEEVRAEVSAALDVTIREFVVILKGSMIKPTVGRAVWFWPEGPVDIRTGNTLQPLAAIVAHVWSDRCVNLAIFDQNGNPLPNPPTSVRLVQEGEELPQSGHYATWMPFQIGQQKAQHAK